MIPYNDSFGQCKLHYCHLQVNLFYIVTCIIISIQNHSDHFQEKEVQICFCR